jgi:hypothetical protein
VIREDVEQRAAIDPQHQAVADRRHGGVERRSRERLVHPDHVA